MVEHSLQILTSEEKATITSPLKSKGTESYLQEQDIQVLDNPP